VVLSVNQPQAAWQPALSKEHHQATFPWVEIPSRIIVTAFPSSLFSSFALEVAVLALPGDVSSRLVLCLG